MTRAAKDELFLGVDVGTTGLKVGAFDTAGNLRGSGHAEYVLYSPRDGWAEQDASRWWEALQSSMRQLREEVDLSAVAALCVVGQGPTAVPVDESGVPLRPAITWADRRAVKEAAWLGERLAGDVSVDFEVLPRMMWIRDNEPEIYRRTRWFFQPYEFLAYRLTGEAVTIDPLRGLPPWTDERLEAAGLDRSRCPGRSVPPGEVLGCVREQVASELGLRSDALVISGTVDAFAHWVGVDLSREGRLCNIGGTSEGVALASRRRLDDPRFRVFSVPSPFDDGWIVGGSASNSGGLLDWVVRTLFGAGATRETVLSSISRIPAGSGGLVALPYFLGERTPIYDPDARGCFFGLNMNHEAAHMGRSLLEGVAFGLRQNIEVLEEVGGSVDEVIVTGGTSQALEWNRIKASVTGRVVRVPAVRDSGVLGAAILACSAATKKPLNQVSQHMVSYTEVIEPDSSSVAVYDQIYPLFLELYRGLEKPFAHLARLGLQS